ncbi:NADPH-dependent oxidoreductase [Lentilactobacillus parabuchneri]|uniref:NADPH-dependent oxidoreductase n=1 Tax=Lentilactobacillus parabuchneri TaxID=152331 RepID=UPI000A103BD1|nr:NADPH-dependent oxidoreductase [Lentilactobacillus parabuchneri]
MPLLTNQIIEQLTQHRSIRNFQNKPLTNEQVAVLVDAAQHASTSTFSQQYSIISVTDPKILKEIGRISGHHWLMNAGHYFVMVADQHRNLRIAKEHDSDPFILHSMDKFLASVFDTAIATENIMVAAESMGLGGTIMGSILNDSQKMIELLNLPELTFPLLGIALGYPADEPELKPRLPKEMFHFRNQYGSDENFDQQLASYDTLVASYYKHRSSNDRTETFSYHIVSELAAGHGRRAELVDVIRKQGFMLH